MLPKAPRIWAFLCLFLALQLAATQSLDVERRDDGNAVAKPSPLPPNPSPTAQDGDDTKDNPTGVMTDAPQATTTKAPDLTNGTSAYLITSSIVTNGPLDNSTFLNGMSCSNLSVVPFCGIIQLSSAT